LPKYLLLASVKNGGITIERLIESPFESLKTLCKTLFKWREEIVRMWRVTKNNGITEGFHRKKKPQEMGKSHMDLEMVRSEGLAPPTPWFEAKYSNINC
jgi:hypothetical protein